MLCRSRQYVFISLYIPHNIKPRMKIATEDFLFGLVPKYPSFYWYWGSKKKHPELIWGRQNSRSSISIWKSCDQQQWKIQKTTSKKSEIKWKYLQTLLRIHLDVVEVLGGEGGGVVTLQLWVRTCIQLGIVTLQFCVRIL